MYQKMIWTGLYQDLQWSLQHTPYPL